MLQRKHARCAALLAIAVGFGVLACPRFAQASAVADLPERTNNLDLPVALPLDAQDAPAVHRPSEPFGLRAAARASGTLPSMWRSAARKLPAEYRTLARCRTKPGKCSTAATRFLAVIDQASNRDGWTRIAEVNRAINLNVRPVSDAALYGAAPFWPTPLMTFRSNAGDCKDYALAKYVALRELGFSADDLRIVVVHIRSTAEYHAITAVRYEDRWLILDNRTSEIRRDDAVFDYHALFVVDGDNMRRMSAPPSARTSQFNAAPSPAKAPLFAGPESLPALA